MKKTILTVCFIVLLLPLTASAFSLKKGDSIYVPKDETIEGKVTGDVICAGQSINISGDVAGDVICAGQSLNISGRIDGNMRLAGNKINFSGQVARNAMILGTTIITSASSTIGWDLFAVGNIFGLMGNIGRDLYGYADKVNLGGQIGKNINLHFGSKDNLAMPLIIASSAKINGDVNYTSLKNVEVENGATIKGEITHNLPTVTARKSNFISLFWWWSNLIAVFSALVIGLVIISFWREPIIKTTDLMLSKASAALGWGILALLLAPLIAVILLITIIGIPLSLILVALWLIALYLSKILVGILIGRKLLTNFAPKQKDSLILGMIIGVVIIYLIFSLPLIGPITSLLAILWGLGGIMLAIKLTLKK